MAFYSGRSELSGWPLASVLRLFSVCPPSTVLCTPYSIGNQGQVWLSDLWTRWHRNCSGTGIGRDVPEQVFISIFVPGLGVDNIAYLFIFFFDYDG